VSRVLQLDKALVVSVAALALYGLATLYSAGQTDVPTFVATIWQRQLVWLALSLIVASLTFRTSPRMLEWATPFAYGIALFLLVLTLFIGTGAGTAAGSKSWLAIGGHRFGQPAELAKLAVILMLAHWLAAQREPPATLRDLIMPGIITGLPCLLVLKQPDLGSAIVFVAILFFMLFWAGAKPSLLLLAASPGIGLVLAFSTVTWGVWIALLAVLLIWWRPYLWEGVAIMGLNVLGGVLALPFWNRLAPYQQNRLLAFLNPDVDPRAAGWHVIQSKVAVGSGGLLGKGFTAGTQKRLAFLPAQQAEKHPGEQTERNQNADEAELLAHHRLHLLGGGRGARLRRRSGCAQFVRLDAFQPAACRPQGHRPVLEPVRLWNCRPLLHAHLRKRGDDDQPHAHHRHPAAVLLLRRLVSARVLDWRRHRAARSVGVPAVRLCRARAIA